MSRTFTAAKSSNWHAFRAPDQEWERTHYQRQSTIEGMIQNVVQNARRAGAPAGPSTSRLGQGVAEPLWVPGSTQSSASARP